MRSGRAASRAGRPAPVQERRTALDGPTKATRPTFRNEPGASYGRDVIPRSAPFHRVAVGERCGPGGLHESSDEFRAGGEAGSRVVDRNLVDARAAAAGVRGAL